MAQAPVPVKPHRRESRDEAFFSGMLIAIETRQYAFLKTDGADF